MAKWYSVALVALLALSAGATEVSNEDKECIEERRKCEERCQQAGGTARTSCERDEARMSTECICMADMRSIGGRRFGPPGGMSQNAEGTSSLSGGTSPFQFEMPSILSDMDNLEKLVHPITWVASLPRIFAEVEDGDEKEGAHGTSDEFPWGKEMPRRHKTGAEGELKRMQMTGDLLRKMVANKLNQGKAKLEQPSVRQEEPPQSGSERQATQEHQGEEERTQNSEETNNSSVDERPTITTIEVTVPGEADRREFPREGAFPQEPYQLAGQSQYNRRSSLNDTLMGKCIACCIRLGCNIGMA